VKFAYVNKRVTASYYELSFNLHSLCFSFSLFFEWRRQSCEYLAVLGAKVLSNRDFSIFLLSHSTERADFIIFITKRERHQVT
jgi:ADP-glucose pyrophosphorylase